MGLFLKDPKTNGIRLNTDMDARFNLELGRAFGFAYGTKENGATFSHMVVKLIYALYERGFVKEGRMFLELLKGMCMDIDVAQIYPHIPEFFDQNARGRYPELTGSGSWFVLMMLTEVFGIRGEAGDLLINPKLSKQDFSVGKDTFVKTGFAVKRIEVIYENLEGLDYGEYWVSDVKILNGSNIKCVYDWSDLARIKREDIEKFPEDTIKIKVVLSSIKKQDAQERTNGIEGLVSGNLSDAVSATSSIESAI